MKTILKIARTELRYLFYAPVAWFLAVAFFVQCAIYYTAMTDPIARWQDALIKNSPKFKGFATSLTSTLFISDTGVFINVLQNLYLFVPLLTMGIISREVNNGTVRLLYSSPVKIAEIVLGKYLAVTIYNLVLMGIVGFFVLSGIINIQHAEYGMLIAGMLGFLLLVSAYAAIGIFMSSLTSYQIVSAIATFLIIFALSNIGGFLQQYDFVRDLTYFLSLSGRTGKMLHGLLTTKDIIYFLVIIFMFLGFTVLRLGGALETQQWYIRAGRYLLVIIVGLGIGYLSSRPALTGYWDTTSNDINTLHPKTQHILEELGDEPLEITLFTNMLGGGSTRGLPQARNQYLSEMWDPYLRFKPNIIFRYEYYYDVLAGDSTMYQNFPGKTLKEISEIFAGPMNVKAAWFKSPEKMPNRAELQAENVRLVMQLKYKGKSTYLRTFEDALFWPGEMMVAAAFKRLMEKQMPKVLFSSGHFERSIYKLGEREFSQLVSKSSRGSLTNNGFDADSINLNTEDIPAGVSSIVVADPKTVLGAVAEQKIKAYIASGGNILLLGEPGKQHILNPLLDPLGVVLSPGTLVQLTKNETPQMIYPYVTLENARLADEDDLIRLLKSGGKDTIAQVAPGAVPILITDSGGFHIRQMLATVPGLAWLKMGPLVIDSAAPVFQPKDGDIRQPSFPVYVSLTRDLRERQQRIIVGGDADFMSNIRAAGGTVSRSYFSWMDNNRFPIYTPRPAPQDDRARLSLSGAEIQRIIYVWVLPAVLALSGIILLIRRKRK